MKYWKDVAMVVSLFFVICLAGCAMLDRMLPSEVDATGNPIPGTHQATASQQAAAGMIPYGVGSVALNALLIVMNGYEKYKVAKIGNGLKSTVAAIKQMQEDPALQAQWEHIQSILKDAHNVANVTPLIKSYISKV